MNFENKTIWITGASSGIGKALAIAFSNYDARLILSARSEKKLLEVKEACKQPEKVEVLPMDLAEHDSFKSKAELALDFFGRVDILINNGGISQRSLAVETDLSIDQRIFNVNYFGSIALTKTLLPYFISNKKGQIVVISSIMGKIGAPSRTAYAGSKHALHGFFDSLRAEIHDKNVKVTIICPGYINTELSINALTADGSKHNINDEGNANGMSPAVFSNKALKVIYKQKQEVVIGGVKETVAVYMKRFSPAILSRIIRKINVT
jgi:short-subunit dehydrogenase